MAMVQQAHSEKLTGRVVFYFSQGGVVKIEHTRDIV